MTAYLPSSGQAATGPPADRLRLTPSTRLAKPPPEGDEAAATAAAGASAELAEVRRGADIAETPSDTPWLVGAAGALAALGWVLERRRRRQLEMEKDSILWATAHAPPRR